MSAEIARPGSVFGAKCCEPMPVQAAAPTPPSYQIKPEGTWVGVPADENGPDIIVCLHTKAADFGSFLTGHIEVTPHRRMDPSTLVVNICHRVLTVRSKERKKESCVKTTKLRKSKLPIDCHLEGGYRYFVPFSIQFPDEVALPECSCGGISHLAAPPPMGFERIPLPHQCASMKLDYVVQAYIRGLTRKVSTPFKFQPSFTSMDLEPFHDNAHKVVRARTMPTGPRKLLGRRSPIEAFGSRVHRHAHSPPGTTFKLGLHTTDRTVRPCVDVQCEVAMHLVASPEGTGMSVGGATSARNTVVISRDTRAFPLQWDENNECILSISYNIPAKFCPLIPSHAGCFTAVVYELRLEIIHKDGSCELILPLVVNNNKNECLPSYGEVVDPIGGSRIGP